MPVVPPTWEAKGEESLASREVKVAVSLDHATALQPGDRARFSLKKQKITVCPTCMYTHCQFKKI